MNKNNITQYITTYAAPAASILGGLILLFSPDTATALLSTIIGWAGLILGVILVIVSLAAKQAKGVIQGGISVAVGLWLRNNPMSLAVGFGKILGICLLIGAFSGFRKSNSRGGRTIYLAEGVLGLVLLISPLTATRAVYTVIGLSLVAAGIVMALNRLKKKDRLDSGDGVIDV